MFQQLCQMLIVTVVALCRVMNMHLLLTRVDSSESNVQVGLSMINNKHSNNNINAFNFPLQCRR